jgi:hypothetical protein
VNDVTMSVAFAKLTTGGAPVGLKLPPVIEIRLVD